MTSRPALALAEDLALPADGTLGTALHAETRGEPPRYGTTTRWKGKRLLTKAERLERQRAQARRWRARNKQKMRAYFQAYRDAHPELKETQATYYRRHRAKWVARAKSDAVKAWRREHRKKHAARLNRQRREWDQKNPERAKAIERRTREKNRARKQQADREYRRAKPDVYKASIARAKAAKPGLYKDIAVASALKRRARKKQILVERVSLKRIAERDRSRCHLCGGPVSRADRTFDHLIPIVRLGAHAEWNLMVAHGHCNKSRGTKQILTEETKAAAEAYIARHFAEVAA